MCRISEPKDKREDWTLTLRLVYRVPAIRNDMEPNLLATTTHLSASNDTTELIRLYKHTEGNYLVQAKAKPTSWIRELKLAEIFLLGF
jgi:hypothetical protein